MRWHCSQVRYQKPSRELPGLKQEDSLEPDMNNQIKSQATDKKALETGKSLRHPPLSITQRQFWLIQQLVPDSFAYNIPE